MRRNTPTTGSSSSTDAAQYVSNSLSNTFASLLEGLMTTGLILYLFLRGWRSTVAVIIAIPTSLISTFFVMYLAGFSFNMMSLMGMALCIGILVDDSIVVLENIHRHMHMGKQADIAAEEGRTEIGMGRHRHHPVRRGRLHADRLHDRHDRASSSASSALTIVFATLFSMFVSFTLTPMIASKLFKTASPSPGAAPGNS